MDDGWQAALEGFDGVWQRVQGGGEVPAPPEPDKGRAALEALLSALTQAEARYRRLGASCAPAAGACAADARQLRGAYFLCCGERFLPAPAPTPEALEALPQRLRQAYLLEQTVGECCDAAAVTAAYSALRRLCERMAERSARRRELVFVLLCRALG